MESNPSVLLQNKHRSDAGQGVAGFQQIGTRVKVEQRAGYYPAGSFDHRLALAP